MSDLEGRMVEVLRKPGSEVVTLLRKLVGGSQPLLGTSITRTAELTGESEWTVKDKLRRGVYKGKKAGRRTIIDFASVKEAWESLPDWTDAKLPASKETLAAAAAGRTRQSAAKRAAGGKFAPNKSTEIQSEKRGRGYSPAAP